jgi:hypothetical protein
MAKLQRQSKVLRIRVHGFADTQPFRLTKRPVGSRLQIMVSKESRQQQAIRRRLAAKRLISAARRPLRLVSPPLELAGKPLSECLTEVRG